MIKEAKTIDFVTTGRKPTDQGFMRISEWIQKNKLKSRRRRISPKTLSKIVLEK